MLISSYVHQFVVHAESSPSGRHILVKLDMGHGVTMTMLPSEAAALRDSLTEALLAIPEGQR